MFKEIFFPEQIGSYYLFSKRILGFDIGKTHVNGTQLLCKGSTITIEKSIAVPLESGTQNNYDERVTKAIKLIYDQSDAHDFVSTSIASSVVIFKEIKLPFLEYNKIEMIIEFEVEPLLPFPVHDAIIDFIITKEHKEEKSSEVLVAAVQKQHIAHHLELFTKAGIDPQIITVDFFALYNVYKLIPSYASQTGGVVIIDLGSQTTTIGYIVNGQLRLIRSIAKGYVSIAKTISQSQNIQLVESIEQILRFGTHKDTDARYAKAMQPAFTSFWQEILFTISSFTAQNDNQPVAKILLLGGGSEIKGITDFVSMLLNIPTEVFLITKILQSTNPKIVTKNSIMPASTLSLSTALSATTAKIFNLRKKELSGTAQNPLFFRQLITAIVLCLCLTASLVTYSVLQLRSLNSEIETGEQEVVTLLKTIVKGTPGSSENLSDMVTKADTFVKREEKLWFSFANPNRPSFLTYLLELTNLINKDELGFVIDKLVINDTNMILTGRVRDHEALKSFEKLLKQSKLLSSFERQDLPEFNNMKIRLKK